MEIFTFLDQIKEKNLEYNNAFFKLGDRPADGQKDQYSYTVRCIQKRKIQHGIQSR